MRRMVGVVVFLGLGLLACGEEDAGPRPGEAKDRRALCEAVCEPFVTCELMDPSGMEACVQLCLTDPSQTAGRLEVCGACLEEVSCEEILTGCEAECTPRSLDLGVELTADGAGELFVAVLDEHTGSLLSTGSAAMENGNALVLLPGAVPEGRATIVHAFLDADVDGTCEDGERTWEVELEAGNEPVTVHLDPQAAAAPHACASFASMDRDLVVKASSLDLEGDPQAYVVLTGERFGRTVSDQRSAPTAQGGFEIRYLRQLAPDAEWTAAFFVDVDGDGVCDPLADAGGLRTLEAPLTGHVNLSLGQADLGTPRCDLFFGVGRNLLLRAGGFERHEGAIVTGVLVHHETLELRTVAAGGVLDGEVLLQFERELALGAPHRVSLFVDLDGDGGCTEADLAAWVEIPAASDDLALQVQDVQRDASACAVQSNRAGL